jgi:hypothetical protein
MASQNSRGGMRLCGLQPNYIVRPFLAQAPAETIRLFQVHDELMPATDTALRFPYHHEHSSPR